MTKAKRRRASRMPVWVRVSVITTVALGGILGGTVLVAGSGVADRGDTGGGHRSRGETQMDVNSDGSGGEHDSGGDRDSSNDHGSGTDHVSGGDRRSARGHG